MKKNIGFTLLELLVVMSIISLLAGLVLSVASGMRYKAMVTNTKGTIMTVLTACGSYHAVFYLYPDLLKPPQKKNATTTWTDWPVLTYPPAAHYTQANYEGFNQRLHYILEGNDKVGGIYTIDEIRHGPFIQDKLPKVDVEYTDCTESMYVDAWGQPLYVCPARDHSLDKPVAGPNYFNSAVPNHYPPDIFSIGPDGVNQIDDEGSLSIGANTKALSSVGYKEDMDDIASWQIRTQ